MKRDIKIVHCADLHIGSELKFLGSRADKRRMEILNSIKVITELCKKENADVLLIAGDLFDSININESAVREVRSVFESADKTEIFICAGNHDYINEASPYIKCEWAENIHIFGSKLSYFENTEKGYRVYGCSFNAPYIEKALKIENIKTDSNFTNLLVVHGETGSGNSKYRPINTEQFRNSGIDYAALGHIHKRSEIKKIGTTAYAYSGCAESVGLDETGEKGVYIGTVGNGCNMQFYPTAVRCAYKCSVDISNAQSDIDAYGIILEQLKGSYKDYNMQMYHITICGRMKSGYYPNSLMISEHLLNNVFFVRVHDETRQEYDIEELAGEQSLKGCFVRNMTAAINSAEGEKRQQLQDALYYGLEAFTKEVSYNEA